MSHRLLFHTAAPGAMRGPEGYTLHWSDTAVMGIVNVTPDSFSDGGKHYKLEHAFKAASDMLAAGAFVIDIGGESTRPGAEQVAADTELDRILPLVKVLATETNALISVDTTKPEVAARALEAGAHIINDVTGLRDPEMIGVCAEAGAPTIIMHMRGEPRTMQQNPCYSDVITEVAAFLRRQTDKALGRGVPSVMLDPGFGFGKTLAHNLRLVNHLSTFVELGQPILLGASRKKSIDALSSVPDAADRDPGSIALHLYAAQQGAAMVRVHNVPAHVQALKVWKALDE